MTIPRFRQNACTGPVALNAESGFYRSVEESSRSVSEGFEDLAWIFTCDSRNRGLIRQGFDEAAVLWKAVKATSGNILEIGRNLAGSTVLLAAATGPDRAIYSIDNRSHEDRACKDYLAGAANKGRMHLLVADSRVPLPNLNFGFLFIDGDHTFEGVLADVVAHWNALQSSGEHPALVAFHDALPNDNFKWRDADRRLNRLWIRVKNKFRRRQKSEVAPDYEPGVLKVCDELIRHGLAAKWQSAGSMLVMKKRGDLPGNFSEIARKTQQS
jgi:predicted O-methyltransferase YrrM